MPKHNQTKAEKRELLAHKRKIKQNQRVSLSSQILRTKTAKNYKGSVKKMKI